MIQLPHRTLESALSVIHELHGTLDLDRLRVAVPELLSRLIPSDRASLNELAVDSRQRAVIPFPTPAYWGELGEICREYLMDHPLWRHNDTTFGCRSITFAEFRNDPRWTRSVMHNEYFRPIGTRHQLAAFVHKAKDSRVSVGFNRSNGAFSSEEQSVFELIIPHIELAWRNARTFTRLQEQFRGLAIPLDMTMRESEVLHWVAEGKRNSEIAIILGISNRTVGKHVEHIFEKLGVETRTAAAQYVRKIPAQKDHDPSTLSP